MGTYLDNVFVFGAYNSSDIVPDAGVANVLALEEVLGHNLLDLLFGLRRKVILLYVKLYNSVVGKQTSFESSGVAFINLVAGDIETLN